MTLAGVKGVGWLLMLLQLLQGVVRCAVRVAGVSAGVRECGDQGSMLSSRVGTPLQAPSLLPFTPLKKDSGPMLTQYAIHT